MEEKKLICKNCGKETGALGHLCDPGLQSIKQRVQAVNLESQIAALIQQLAEVLRPGGFGQPIGVGWGDRCQR